MAIRDRARERREVARQVAADAWARSTSFCADAIEELRAAEPDLLLFPDEPYPFRETDLAPFQEIAPARISGSFS